MLLRLGTNEHYLIVELVREANCVIFSIFVFFIGILPQISNVEIRFSRFLTNFSEQNPTFLRQELNARQKCSFELKERTLTFSKLQKLLKSKYYS